MGTESCDLSVVILITTVAIFTSLCTKSIGCGGVQIDVRCSYAPIHSWNDHRHIIQFSITFPENLRVVMLIYYTVIQNFDSSEFQANGHHRFKQRR